MAKLKNTKDKQSDNKECCGTCFYYRRSPSAKALMCKYNPPEVVHVGYDAQMVEMPRNKLVSTNTEPQVTQAQQTKTVLGSGWPAPREDEWCGQWRSRNE